MQSSVLAALTPLARWECPWAALDVQTALAQVPDPRRRQGRRFSLRAILTLILAGLLADQPSEQAIAEWGADLAPDLKRARGFPKATTPHHTTLQRLLRRLDPLALTAALQRVFDPPTPSPPARGADGVSLDGKAQRGRLAFGPPGGAPVHALTAFRHRDRTVLAQLPITRHADKAEAELSVAPALVAHLDWRGRVLTGDALLCQRALCQQVLAAQGDYLLLVKENQPTLYQAIEWLFDPPAAWGPARPLRDHRSVARTEKGHGRLETRRLVASTDLTDYLDWPGLAQVVRIERTWTARGVTKHQRHYGITSLPPTIGTAQRLLALKRGHWQIENGLHYILDETLGEDRSTVHLDAGPSVLACLRGAVISLLHRAGIAQIAKQVRYHSRHPAAVLPLLDCSSP